MFNEERIDQSLVLDELARLLEADVSYASRYPIASMSSIPHPIGQKVFCDNIEKNAGRYYTFPGAKRVKREVLEMITELLHLPNGVGVTTSGGTESNILAMLAARENHNRQTSHLHIIAPKTIHSSIDKAA